jgi:hypothetical protein
MAVLILTAGVGAASASASGFEAESHPATVKGVTEGNFQQFVTGTEWGAGCTGLEFEASAENPTHTLTSKQVADGTCTWFSSGATLKMNGCKLIYHPGSEISPGRFGGSFEIGPSGCGPAVYVQGTPNKCEVSIGSQAGLDAEYRNFGSGTGAGVEIIAKATNLEYTKKAGGNCVSGTLKNGHWEGTWKAYAFQSSVQKGISVKNQIRTLIGITGEKSADTSKQPKFEAGSYPVQLNGEQSGAKPTFTVNAGTSSCSSAKYAETVSGPTAEVALAPTFGECVTFGFASVPQVNGCELVVHVLNLGPPYVGSADVACPAGQSIELVSKAAGIVKCTVTIPSQTGLEGVSLANTNFGFGVSVGFNLSGIHYHQQAGTGIGSCKSSGDFTDGAYSGTVSLQGLS